MDTYGFTSRYLTKNDQCWFPVMGEIHYSRYPAQYWKESLLKMKAGGVDIVSTYVIWIHHEEIEGEWDFTGNRNLRSFAEICRECGLTLMVRIGPWCHGEVRNGGFPDWLLKKPFKSRTNDERYFTTVETFYRKIFTQVQGLLLKDGGPIIGVQIENEYGHCGGLSGEEGEQHMATLAALARDIGFDVPLYTATGWGGAVTGGMFPVMGGYCEAPWDQRLTDIEPSGNYIFTHERNDHNIGSDFGFGKGITFDISQFPYLTAELGGGLQVTRHRRPVARAKDIAAMSLVKLGSGVNLLGYYMYHGGTNPAGKLTTLHETKDSGSINDLPELSYDFRAPIREYGQISDTFRELRLLTFFLHDFGSALCGMDAFIPSENPSFPADKTGLRHSFRRDGETGYLFVNNYQRRQIQAKHADVTISVPEIDVIFPPLNITDGDFFFLPFNMKLGSTVLISALVTPLCVLNREKPVYVFYAAFAQAEELLAAGKTDSLYQFKDRKKPVDVEIMTLSRKDALNAWKVGESLIFSEGEILEEDGTVFEYIRADERTLSPTLISRTAEMAVYQFSIPEWNANDCFLSIAYEGNTAKLYEDDILIADHFYVGSEYPWEIGLKRFGSGNSHTFRVEIETLTQDTQVFLETWPLMENGVACRLTNATLVLQKKRAYPAGV